MIINRETLDGAFTAFSALFNQGLGSVSPVWQQIATLVPSNTATQSYNWIGQFPGLREWIGDREVKNLTAHQYAIQNKDFEATVGIDRNHFEDDQIGVFNPLFQAMGQAAATHPDELVFQLLTNGHTTLCYDKQYFFDTDHPVSNGTVSNNLGGAGTPWFLLDTSRTLKPLIFQRRRDYALVSMTKPDDEQVYTRREYRYGVDGRMNVGFGFWQMAVRSAQPLDETNYAAARAAMMSFKSDEGRPLGMRPTLLVVPPTLEAAGLKLLQAENNAAGATNVYRNSAQLLVSPWLS